MILILVTLIVPHAIGRDRGVPPTGTRFTCTPISLWDGDGPIWCAEGPRVRLAGINARELDGSCRPRARCVQVSGIVARNRLAGLLGRVAGRTRDGHLHLSAAPVACVSLGPDRYHRTLANCSTRGRDIAAALVASGTVAR